MFGGGGWCVFVVVAHGSLVLCKRHIEMCECACHRLSAADPANAIFRVRFLAGAAEGGPIDTLVQGSSDWTIRKLREHLFKVCMGSTNSDRDDSSSSTRDSSSSSTSNSSAKISPSIHHTATLSLSVSSTTSSSSSSATIAQQQVSLTVSAAAFEKLDIYFNGRLVRDVEQLSDIVLQCFQPHKIPYDKLAGHGLCGHSHSGGGSIPLPKCFELPVICAKHDPCRCRSVKENSRISSECTTSYCGNHVSTTLRSQLAQ
jgi:hypothetical protein